LTVVCCGEACELPVSLDLRGLLSFWLLWELRLGPLRGAQLAERLAWRRGQPVSPGTLYPALAALEKGGAVRKQRRGRDTSYALTAAGKRELACAAAYVRAVFRDVLEAPTARAPR
jgi:DNA-binding PadR family transcriptional regulator